MRGFSLFEMLIALLINSIIIVSIISFYPQLHTAIMRVYLTNLLEEITEQTLAGLIKDLRRAGFIANSLTTVSKKAIEINAAGNCLILRYDVTGRGEWRDLPYDQQNSDIFTYRYNKHNLEYQPSFANCNNTAMRWEKLFDPNEVYVNQFQLKQYPLYTRIDISLQLKHYPFIQYQTTHYVKHYNR